MKEKTTTVRMNRSIEAFRTNVYAYFEVCESGIVGSTPFDGTDRSPGNVNTIDSHNGSGHPRQVEEWTFEGNAIPSQVIEVFGPEEGAAILAQSWINTLEEQDYPLIPREKRALIDTAIERYGVRVGLAEIAAEKAAVVEFGLSVRDVHYTDIPDMELGYSGTGPKADTVFTNGERMQTKFEVAHSYGRNSKDKVSCEYAAKVTVPDESEPTFEVSIRQKE